MFGFLADLADLADLFYKLIFNFQYRNIDFIAIKKDVKKEAYFFKRRTKMYAENLNF